MSWALTKLREALYGRPESGHCIELRNGGRVTIRLTSGREITLHSQSAPTVSGNILHTPQVLTVAEAREISQALWAEAMEAERA